MSPTTYKESTTLGFIDFGQHLKTQKMEQENQISAYLIVIGRILKIHSPPTRFPFPGFSVKH